MRRGRKSRELGGRGEGRRAVRALGVLALAIVCGAPASPPALAGPAEREPDLILLFTGDTIGYVDPCG